MTDDGRWLTLLGVVGAAGLSLLRSRGSRVLSIDLDAFISPTIYDKDEHDHRRPSSAEHRVLQDNEIVRLAGRFGLAPDTRGACIEHHHQILDALRTEIEAGRIVLPIDLVHVDAHADLGWGEEVWQKILGDVVGRPPAERQTFHSGLTLGNWLSYAIAWGWIGSVLHVRPPVPPQERWLDVGRMFFRDGDNQRSELDLVFMPEVLKRPPSEDPDPLQVLELQRLQRDRPTVIRIPFVVRDFTNVRPQPAADFAVLCRSPGFTPKSADRAYALLQDRLAQSSAVIQSRRRG